MCSKNLIAAENKKPGLQSKAGHACRFSSICVGLSPRRPQAGFDLNNQIGAIELYVNSRMNFEALTQLHRETLHKFSCWQSFAPRLL
jgi:hypothetical protein